MFSDELDGYAGPTIAAALAERSQFPQFAGMGLAESRVGIGRSGGRERPCISAIFTSHPPVERSAEGGIGGTKPIPPVWGYAPVATLCPPDCRIAGEVQAIGGKWMKMEEKEVVTEKGLLGSAAPETWRAEIGSPPPNRVNCVIPRRLLPWRACHGIDPAAHSWLAQTSPIETCGPRPKVTLR